MKLRKYSIIAGFMIVATVAAMTGYDWYYRTCVWPKDIQETVLGIQIADGSMLVKQEGSSHFGEGMFRWQYHVNMEDRNLVRLCGNQVLRNCHFSKTVNVSADVALTAIYSRGELILEEVWS